MGDEQMTSEQFKKILDDHEDYEIRVFFGRMNVRIMRLQLLREVERLASCQSLNIAIEFDHGYHRMDIFPLRE